jgi:hypothetical protein
MYNLTTFKRSYILIAFRYKNSRDIKFLLAITVLYLYAISALFFIVPKVLIGTFKDPLTLARVYMYDDFLKTFLLTDFRKYEL